MFDEIRFNLNGAEAVYTGAPSERLLDVLRNDFRLTGTKCGCKEGECGACAVIIDGRLINSCLVAIGSIDGSNVTTIEGYCKTERFAALDKAYEAVSAVQCGFCMPGMIMASECLLASNPNPTEEEIRAGISGNLCRCTGYNSIVKAIGMAADSLGKSPAPEGASGDSPPTDACGDPPTCTCGDPPAGACGASPAGACGASPPTDACGDPPTDGSASPAGRASGSRGGAAKTSAPESLEEALAMRKDPELIPYTGGTDLMVKTDLLAGDEGAKYLFLHKVPEMKQITEDGEYIRFGASCTFAEVIENPLSPKILKEACLRIAAPAIRNAGSLGGNIGNGSPKADSALIFMVTDSNLRLACASGERILPIRDFYLGRKKLALAPDELIVEILMPRHGLGNYYYEKVGARNALSIARLSFAGIMDIDVEAAGFRGPDERSDTASVGNGENRVIKNCAIAFGAVSDVIIRREDIDQMLIGKTIREAKALKDAFIGAYDKAIVPIRGRVGVEYRKDVCMNLLRDFLQANGI